MGEPAYLYLHDSPYHTNFQDAVEDSTTAIDTKYEVYVGMYSLAKTFTIDETAGKIPFLRFLSILENDTYTFPHFSCTMATFDSEYVTYLMKLFELNVTGNESLSPSPFYSEHVLINEKANTAIVLFSFDTMAKKEVFSNHAILSLDDSTPVSNMKWAVVDEILFEKKLLTLPFDPKVTEFFLRHEPLWNIEYDKVYIDFPFSVYPVGETDGKLANTTGEVQPLDSYSRHEDYGNRYCFTYLPIGPVDNLIRYAMYTYQTKYLVGQSGGENKEQDKNDTLNSEKVKVYSEDSEVSLDKNDTPILESEKDSLKENKNDTPILESGKDSLKENKNDTLNSENIKDPSEDSEVSLDKETTQEEKSNDVSLDKNDTPILESGKDSLNKNNISQDTFPENTQDKMAKSDEGEDSKEFLSQDKSQNKIDALNENENQQESVEESLNLPPLEEVSLKEKKIDTPNSKKVKVDSVDSEVSLDKETIQEEKSNDVSLDKENTQDKIDTPISLNENEQPQESVEKIEEPPFVIPGPDTNKSNMEDSEESLSRLTIPTIYFNEPIDGNPTIMWGILNPNLLSKL
jgi:hypothetical protein